MPKRKLCENPERTYFGYVPDEILYQIASMLSTFDLCRLAMISQRLHRVCADKRLWISASVTEQEITLSDIEMLIRSSFPIKKLDLTGSWMPDVQHHQWPIPSNFHMTLEKLDLTKYGRRLICYHNTDDVLYILERCRTKELILDLFLRLFNSRLMEAISNNENLEVLSMEWTNFGAISVDDIQKLFNRCNRLKELNFFDCLLSTRQLRDVCVHIPETVEKLVLTEVYFTETDDYDSDEVDVLVESYGILFQRAKNLKYLGTPLEHLKMPAIMRRIIQHQNLETLRLCDHDVYEQDFFRVLEEATTNLKKIDIFLTVSPTAYEGHLEAITAKVEEVKETLIDVDMEIFDPFCK